MTMTPFARRLARLLTLVLMLWAAPCWALQTAPKPQSPAEQAAAFDAGCHAFDQGRWEAAEAAFSDLEAQGLPSGWLAYNLGNSHLKAGRLGEAIASFRRALTDVPRHSDIRANLGFARRRVQDAVAPAEPTPTARTLFFWHYVLSRRETLWLLGACLAVFWICRAAALFGRQKRLLRGVSLGAGLLSVALGASWAAHMTFARTLGVVTADAVEVRTTNQPQAPVRFILHAGCETWVQSRLDGWVQVALSDGKQGWLPRQSVALVPL